MWYNKDATPNRIVDKLTDKRLANLPMGYDPMYREQGKVWHCAGWSMEHLGAWFSKQDFEELEVMGFRAIKFHAKEFIIDENQVRFTFNGANQTIDITDEFKEYLNERYTYKVKESIL